MLPSTRALTNSVQSFPPPNSVGPGPLIWDVVRGPILPPRGTKERDRVLRLYDTHEYNDLWQGARSGITKKLANVTYKVNGPQGKAQYYQDVLGNAHFGHGWEYLLKMGLRDFLSQSYGFIFEIAGPGEPDAPLLEAPTGLNHLDAGRCLGRDSRITMADGTTRSIRSIVLEKNAGPVMAVDECGRLVPRAITGWHENRLNGRYWLRISLSHAEYTFGKPEGLWVTNDHPIMTPDGYIEAENLVEGSHIVTEYPALSEDQMDVFVGMMLGDSGLSRPKRNASGISLSHGQKQRDWLIHKQRVLDGLGWSPIRGVAGKTLQSDSHKSPFFKLEREEWYPDGKKIVNRAEVERYFGPRMLATWYMDDGTIHRRSFGNLPSIHLCTHGFSKEDVEWLSSLLNEHGYKSTVQTARFNHSPKTYYLIYITVEGSTRFFKDIAPYVIPSMRYKLPLAHKEYDPTLWNVQPATRFVDTVEMINTGSNGEQITTYCIDVEEYHNFIAGGMAVHNCYVTGNPIYPILYYSLWDGRLHKMHASRVYMMVDDPIPDERYFGIGSCALERAIAISQRQIRMGEYIDAMLDDKPQPGLLSLTGVSDNNWQALMSRYLQQQQNDERPVFGRTIVLTSLDPNAAVKAEVIPFSQTPEKFDFIKYNDLDVSAMALALGVDRQELWELAGRGLGSGSQAAVLSMKSRAKLYGDVLSGLERFMNWAFLPDDCEFEFVEHDDVARASQASIDVQLAQIAQTLSAIPGITPLEIKKILVARSDTFKDAMTNDLGQVTLPSGDPQTPQQITGQDTTLADNTPAAAPGKAPVGALPQASNVVQAQAKAFSATSADFRNRFTDIVTRAVEKRIRRNQAESLLLSLLLSSGTKAFADGLAQGGVTDMDDDDQAQIQNFVSDQIDYLDPFIASAFDGSLPVDQIVTRAEMWSNKSLTQMYNAGRISADKNGYYQWKLGRTEQHCPDCEHLDGQIHRFQEYYKSGWLPQSDRLKCKGFRCDCRLVRVKGPAQGRLKAFNPSQARDDSGKWTSGGAYRHMKPAKGEEIHHMPAAQASPLNPRHGPAIRMDKADHFKTTSYGTSRTAREYRDRQRRLIIEGKFHEALQMDIDDVRSKFSNKYDDAIRELQDYANTLRFSSNTNMPRDPKPMRRRVAAR